MIITEVDDLVAGPVSRVIIRDPDASADDFVELAADLGLHGTDYVVGWTAWLDLSAGRRLQGVRAGASSPTSSASTRPTSLAIGDGRNDIEMLQWAGRGVAMGQAIEEVREAADAVTDTVYDDGAATELSARWFPDAVSLPRLVATDLDGTLVRSDGTVSPYTHDVLAELDERGVPVVFVTGRPLRWAEEVFQYVGAHGLAIVSNGALVWDVARNRGRPGPRDPGRRRTRGLPADPGGRPGATFAVETLAGIALESVVPGAAPGPRRQPSRRPRRGVRRPGAQDAGAARGAAGPGVLGPRAGRGRRTAR